MAVARRVRTAGTACAMLLLAVVVTGWVTERQRADLFHVDAAVGGRGEVNAEIVGYASHIVFCVRTDVNPNESATRFFHGFAHDPVRSDADFDPHCDVGGWNGWTWREWLGVDSDTRKTLGWHAEVGGGHPRGAEDVYLFVPNWFLAAAAAVLPARALRRWRAERCNRLIGRCRRCGYDLRATPSRCPECGTGVMLRA